MFKVFREVVDGGETVTTHPIGRSFDNYGDAISFASFAATDHMMSQNVADMKNLTNGVYLIMSSGMSISYVVKNLDENDNGNSRADLQATVDDLQKVLGALKEHRPNNWTTVMNANGDLMAVPILAALVQGYSELAKLEGR